MTVYCFSSVLLLLLLLLYIHIKDTTYYKTVSILLFQLFKKKKELLFAMSASTEKKKRVERKNRLDEIKKPRGYERGLLVDEIVGVTDYTGDLLYLIRWRDCNELDLLPSSEVNDKSPQEVLKFNEKRCRLNKLVNDNNLTNIPINVVDKVRLVVETTEESEQKPEPLE